MALHPSGAFAGQLVQFGDAFDNAPAQRLLGYLAKPDGAGPFPAVIVMHGCDGFNPRMPLVAERLKSWGYVALAIEASDLGAARMHAPAGCSINHSTPMPV